jgi:hypothetical protein
MTDDDELTTAERRALDDWPVIAPPAGFADRVVAAQRRPAVPRMRRLPIIACTFGAAAAIALVVAVTRGPDASDGSLAVTTRTTAEIGTRATIVAEPSAALRWHVSSSGSAEIDQTAGDVFYRVERGGPFVIHTPAGDVRVTGTCLRVEVVMKPRAQILVSGAVGAALATAVVITVYEGHVIADSRDAHTDLVAGSHTTLSNEPNGAPALVTASRDELVALATAREEQIGHLKSRIAELESKTGTKQSGAFVRVQGENIPYVPHDDTEDGRLWHDPSHDKLVEWAQHCHIQFDEPFDAPREDLAQRGLQPGEVDGYNAAVTEIQKDWHAALRALYIEATGDTTGADTLSDESMRNEIVAKSPPGETSVILQKIARERAGLAQPPGDLSKTSPLERMLRMQSSLGDQTEQALAKRVGAPRAHDIRGEGWGSQHEMSGCPKQ